jgi:hypothetical protein
MYRVRNLITGLGCLYYVLFSKIGTIYCHSLKGKRLLPVTQELASTMHTQPTKRKKPREKRNTKKLTMLPQEAKDH